MPGGALYKSTQPITAAQQAATVVGLGSSMDVAVQITGTLSATITFEVTVDGTTWVAAAMTPAAGGSTVTSATAVGAWSASVGGYAGFRARCSAFTSATTCVVTVRASAR